MTGREMNIEFERGIGEIDPALKLAEKPTTATIFHFINVEQDKFIKQLFADSSAQHTEEWLQLRTDYLKALITRSVLFPVGADTVIIGGAYASYPTLNQFPLGTTVTQDNGIKISLPTDYMFYIKSDAKLNAAHGNGTTPRWVQNKDISHEDVQFVLNNTFNRPIFRNAFTVLEQSSMVIYKDYYTDIYNIATTYYRKPATISLTVDCELSDSCHKNIVNAAVNSYIEDYRYKLQKPSKQKQS